MNTTNTIDINNIALSFLDTDSYKFSHMARFNKSMFPKNMDYAMAYLEARKGDHTLFFGLNYILKNFKVPTLNEVELASKLIECHMSKDIFNKEGWISVSEKGYLPLKIKAVPEGTIINGKEVLLTVENTEPGYAWLVGWFETMLLRIWYPTTVATISYDIKQMLKKYLEKNGNLNDLDFMLHDFGSRGTTCAEQAGIGGMAHLINFKGSDTFNSFLYAIQYYNADMNNLSFSIPASEHSTITSWGKDNEVDAYKNIIETFGGEGKVFSCVSDSYNIWNALKIWKQLEPTLLKVGGRLVVRPDSGDPVETPIKVIEELMNLFGYSYNEKGYKILPNHIRVIQGDGVYKESIEMILKTLDEKGISSSNIVFGMGGALLQRVNRDTFSFAYKVCSVTIDGDERDVFKSPIGDNSKASKKGRITLNKDKKTVLLKDIDPEDELLNVVYLNGKILSKDDFSTIRERSNM